MCCAGKGSGLKGLSDCGAAQVHGSPPGHNRQVLYRPAAAAAEAAEATAAMSLLQGQPASAELPPMQLEQQQPTAAAPQQQAQQPPAAHAQADNAAAPAPALQQQRPAAELTAGDIPEPTSHCPGVSWDHGALKWAVHVQHGAEVLLCCASMAALPTACRLYHALTACWVAVQTIPCGVFASEEEATMAHERISQQLKASEQVPQLCCHLVFCLIPCLTLLRTLPAHKPLQYRMGLGASLA